jgi:acetyl/propionyl-CoA carboxylase alpha subunit
MTTIRRVLVANRGEIARRVMRTCRALGIHTVAVYSDADADAAHVHDADEAVRLGPAPSSESYLVAGAVLEAARTTGADAIHPGYGFLSENADFADAVEAAGLVWIGPPGSAMRALGAKAPARQLAARLGVPTVPGFDGEADDEALAAAALTVGFPLLIKASAGGGGRGMRRVDRADDLADALASARREAVAAFGDGRLLLERLIERPRHIEVQVMADAHGHVVHLLERECSIQRRHQKILEEAPSPFVDEALRARLGELAVTLARAVGYRSAGTVEFIVDQGGAAYFLEMNTRLQVEHPVTELITGLDLVALQLRIAEGRPLGLAQADIRAHGHAIEARVCAEDPNRDWLPASGLLRAFRVLEGDGVRVDAGFRDGDAVPVHYDSMLAKVIAWGEDREDAARRLHRALVGAWAPGLVSNLPLLRDVLVDEAFLAGDLDTGFLARRGLPRPVPMNTERGVVVGAALAFALRGTADGVPAGWRVDGPAWEEDRFAGPDQELVAATRAAPGGVDVAVGGVTRRVRVALVGSDAARVDVDGHTRLVRFARSGGPGPLVDDETLWLHLGDAEAMVRLVPRLPPPASALADPGSCVAPTPGVVRQVRVAPGDTVAAGDVLVVLEAMKTEHALRAPEAGTVAAVRVAPGDAVDAGALLVRIEAG